MTHGLEPSEAEADSGLLIEDQEGESGSPEESQGGDGQPEEEGEEESVYWGHQAQGLPEGSAGLDRLTHLGASALKDLFSEYPEAGKDPGRLGLILCLSSGYLDWAQAFKAGEANDGFPTGVFVDPDEGARVEEMKNSLVSNLLSLVPDLPEPAWTGLVLEDQAGFAEGVARAAALLTQGRLDSCLLGGIDCRVDPEMLKALEEMGLLQTPDFPAGFIPGEAGAFLLLTAPASAPEPLAWIEATAQGAEGAHRLSGAPQVGAALTETVRTALGKLESTDALTLVLGSANGSPWNSNEWGYLLSRVRALGAARHWFPVDGFGEVGASLGPVAACTAMRGFSRGYAGGDRALLVLSSESGRKGAVVMSRWGKGGGTL